MDTKRIRSPKLGWGAFIVLPVICCAFLIAVSTAAAEDLTDLEKRIKAAIEKVGPAVVTVKVEGKAVTQNNIEIFKDNKLFKKFFKGFKLPRYGSGMIVDSSGSVATCSSLLKDAEKVTVNLPDGREYAARVVGIDKVSGIAVIGIDAEGLPTVTFGDSDDLKRGRLVLTLYNFSSGSESVSLGIVSATGRSNIGMLDYEDFIQTDAAMPPGSAGGPLADLHGNVFGMCSAVVSRGGTSPSLGFAIPSSVVQRIADELIHHGKVRRGLLGVKIQNLNPSLAESFGRKTTEGALVSGTIPGSSAEKAGLRSEDIILEIAGNPIRDVNGLRNTVSLLKPRETVDIRIFRDGKVKIITAEIGERPRAAESSTLEKNPEQPVSETGGTHDNTGSLGANVKPLSERELRKLGIYAGIRVASVQEGTPASEMGLSGEDVILDVNGEPVKSPQDLKAQVKKAAAGGVVRFKIMRGRNVIFLATSIKE